MFRKVFSIGLSFVLTISQFALAQPIQFSGFLPLTEADVANQMNFGMQIPVLQGVTVYPEDPFQFDFIVQSSMGHQDEFSQDDYQKQIKYFLAALAVPSDELWVNLSPTDSDRILSDHLDQTDLGQDMLAQDYVLKQMTASLMNPDSEIGQKFWNQIYKKVYESTGQTDVLLDSFNRVWIVPKSADIYEAGQTAFIMNSELKVLLDHEYVAEKHQTEPLQDAFDPLMRDIVIPALEHEVNHGEHFASLRQIYHAVMLASWYKQAIANSLINESFSDQAQMGSVRDHNLLKREDIYQNYLSSFDQGLHEIIREEYDPKSQQMTTKKYITGGAILNVTGGDSGMLNVFNAFKPLLPKQVNRLKQTIQTNDFAELNMKLEGHDEQKNDRALFDTGDEQTLTEDSSDQAMVADDAEFQAYVQQMKSFLTTNIRDYNFSKLTYESVIQKMIAIGYIDEKWEGDVKQRNKVTLMAFELFAEKINGNIHPWDKKHQLIEDSYYSIFFNWINNYENIYSAFGDLVEEYFDDQVVLEKIIDISRANNYDYNYDEQNKYDQKIGDFVYILFQKMKQKYDHLDNELLKINYVDQKTLLFISNHLAWRSFELGDDEIKEIVFETDTLIELKDILMKIYFSRKSSNIKNQYRKEHFIFTSTFNSEVVRFDDLNRNYWDKDNVQRLID